jgi:hypothetical protein
MPALPERHYVARAWRHHAAVEAAAMAPDDSYGLVGGPANVTLSITDHKVTVSQTAVRIGIAAIVSSGPLRRAPRSRAVAG